MITYTYITDKDVQEALNEARNIFSDRIYVAEQFVTQRYWFKKTTYPVYTIYIVVNDQTKECQIVNFYNKEGNIFTKVPKDLILPYLYGLITGKRFINF